MFDRCREELNQLMAAKGLPLKKVPGSGHDEV
jgi:hypothetical protein